MKALVLEDKEKLNICEFDIPTPKENEVLLEIKACGVCSSDFNRVYKDSAYFFPLILGHEFSGVVKECGESVEKNVIGKKVAVFPLIPCNECEFCKQKQYAQCKKYNYFGSRCHGAMAEYICVPYWNIKILPDDMSCKIASMSEPAAVAAHAIKKIKNIENKEVCIFGTGAIGIMIGLMVKSRGAIPYFALRNEKKKEFLKALGFNNFLDKEKDVSRFEYVIECVGTNVAINDSINYVKSKGIVVFVGNPEGDITFEKKNYWKILRSELNIIGVWNSEYKNTQVDDWDDAIEFLYKNQKIAEKLITNEYKLEDKINIFEQNSNESIRLKGVIVNE